MKTLLRFRNGIQAALTGGQRRTLNNLHHHPTALSCIVTHAIQSKGAFNLALGHWTWKKERNNFIFFTSRQALWTESPINCQNCYYIKTASSKDFKSVSRWCCTDIAYPDKLCCDRCRLTVLFWNGKQGTFSLLENSGFPDTDSLLTSHSLKKCNFDTKAVTLRDVQSLKW